MGGVDWLGYDDRELKELLTFASNVAEGKGIYSDDDDDDDPDYSADTINKRFMDAVKTRLHPCDRPFVDKDVRRQLEEALDDPFKPTWKEMKVAIDSEIMNCGNDVEVGRRKGRFLNCSAEVPARLGLTEEQLHERIKKIERHQRVSVPVYHRQPDPVPIRPVRPVPADADADSLAVFGRHAELHQHLPGQLLPAKPHAEVRRSRFARPQPAKHLTEAERRAKVAERTDQFLKEFADDETAASPAKLPNWVVQKAAREEAAQRRAAQDVKYHGEITDLSGELSPIVRTNVAFGRRAAHSGGAAQAGAWVALALVTVAMAALA